MINIISLYNDVVQDANKPENGELSYLEFNGLVWRAQLRLMNWLTGNFDDGASPPESISSQKSRDWLSVFIKRKAAQVTNGFIDKPADYFLFRSLYKLKGVVVPAGDCDDEEYLETRKEPIEILDNSKFTNRCATSIKRLQPKVKPIAQLSENDKFEFAPKDTGSVVLEYYRLPRKAEIKTTIDEVYNNEVPDEALTTHLEFNEAARPALVWFTLDAYYTHNRDVTGKQFEQTQTGKPKQ